MDTRFVVPVIVSTAFHALVFLLGTGSTAPVTGRAPEPGPKPVEYVPIALLDEEPPPVIEMTEEKTSGRKGSDEIAGPQLPELWDKAPVDVMTFKPDPVRPDPGIADHIPAMPWGDPKVLEDGTGGRAILNPQMLDRPPRTRSQIAPEYPDDARKGGLRGEVLVRFIVDESGHVLNPRVVRSTDSRFEANTLRAVERWRFEPGKKDGHPVRFRMVVPVMFSLGE